MLAPAGADVWATPTLDVRRRALYVATGNAFSGTSTSECRDGSQHGHRKMCGPCKHWRSMSGTTVVFRMFPGVAAKRTRWCTARRACCGARGGGPREPVSSGELSAAEYPRPRLGLRRSCRHLRGCPTDAKSSSQRRSKDSSGQSTRSGQVLWKQDVAREIDGGRGEPLGGAVDSGGEYFRADQQRPRCSRFKDWRGSVVDAGHAAGRTAESARHRCADHSRRSAIRRP